MSKNDPEMMEAKLRYFIGCALVVILAGTIFTILSLYTRSTRSTWRSCKTRSTSRSTSACTRARTSGCLPGGRGEGGGLPTSFLFGISPVAPRSMGQFVSPFAKGPPTVDDGGTTTLVTPSVDSSARAPSSAAV